MGAESIILGVGVFAIGGTDIALTRGGGQFTVEREYRQIEADGDMGPVKDRIVLEKSVAKMTINALELLPENIPKMYPGIEEDKTSNPGTSIIKGKEVETEDYNATVTWTGKTKAGKAVVITLENAINLENFDWSLKEKDDVVPSLTYTATYLETARTTEPWKIEYATA